MNSLGYDQYQRLSEQGGWVPVFRELPGDLLTPVSAFLAVSARSERAWRSRELGRVEDDETERLDVAHGENTPRDPRSRMVSGQYTTALSPKSRRYSLRCARARG